MKKTTKISYRNFKFLGVLLWATFLLAGCEDFLEADGPNDQISNQQVFADEATATAAVTTMYAKLRDEVLLTGRVNGLSLLLGLYTDELDYYQLLSDPTGSFYMHQIIESNSVVTSVWNNTYHLIYLSNAVLEGLQNAPNLTTEVKTNLQGEALFVRGLAHFYLVSLYGEVPYIKTTDYEQNSTVVRMPVDLVYQNIVSDLKNSKEMLVAADIGDKVRPNSLVISALKARIYLYLEQWNLAEMVSNSLIGQSQYHLEEDITKVFLKESTETIWQFRPKNNGGNTHEGTTFFIAGGPPQTVALNSNFVGTIEENDLRKTHWIGEVSNGTDTWYFPYKYKENQNTGASLEHSIVFRLAEQYLIRAEARLRQGNTSGALEDLNRIRGRAGLDHLIESSPENILNAIIEERRIELFTEHGHRWFDLKRTGNAAKVLAPIKSGWKSTNVLLPIPESELLRNSNLLPQNPGY